MHCIYQQDTVNKDHDCKADGLFEHLSAIKGAYENEKKNFNEVDLYFVYLTLESRDTFTERDRHFNHNANNGNGNKNTNKDNGNFLIDLIKKKFVKQS